MAIRVDCSILLSSCSMTMTSRLSGRRRVIPLGVTDACWLKSDELWKHELTIAMVVAENPSNDAGVLSAMLRDVYGVLVKREALLHFCHHKDLWSDLILL